MKFIKEINYEVAVVGGGVAGVACALQSARLGRRVVLIEKTVQLGGLATIGLINYFVPMCNGRGVQIIKGMADEFLRLSIEYGYDTIPHDWKNGEPGQGKTLQRLATRYSAPIFSLALLKELQENGVTVMFDTVVTNAFLNGGKIEYLIAFNKSGYTKVNSKTFVDASGDADLLRFAGIPTVIGENYHTYIAFQNTLQGCKEALENGDIEKTERVVNGGTANLYGGNHPEGKAKWIGVNGDHVSAYLIENQLELLEKIKNDNRKERTVTMLPGMCQFRTSAHIDGDYTLKESDAYKHFEDSVCAICDFDRRDYLYEVPYRTMIRSGYDNVIAVGRCASASGYAWDVLRVIPPAILTGQAAGFAVDIAIENNQSLTKISVSKLQEQLENANVQVHFNDNLVPKDKE